MNQNQNEQTQMSIIGLNADRFELVGQVTNWEELFLNKENFRQILIDAQKIGRGLVADPTTKEGTIQIKTMAKKISTLKNLIEEKGKEVAAELKAKPKLIDATRKEVKDTLDKLKEDVLKPIVDIEKRQEQITEIDNMPAQAMMYDSVGIEEQIAKLADLREKGIDYWQESFEDASKSIADSMRQLNEFLLSARKKEAEQKELEELRAQKEAAQRIIQEQEIKKARDEAAEKAREEAWQKLKEAEKARKAAEEAANQRIRETEQKLKEAESKIQKQSNIQSNVSNKLVSRETKTRIKESLIENCFITEETARAIVIAIIENKIPHVGIVG
jgi:colicin import membrane protein